MTDSPQTFITLAELEHQLSIDEVLTIHDNRINLLIRGVPVSLAENYTQRSLAQLMRLTLPPLDSASQACRAR